MSKILLSKILPATLTAALTLAATLVATPALAHSGHGAAGFAAGLLHPFSGLDHLLAMVGVGIWAAQLGGRNLWLVPLAFLGTMVAGAVLSMSALPLPHVELGIAGSVIAIGLLIGLGARLPSGMAAAVVALLALFHGHAHGSEAPAAASATWYAAGFVLGTMGLHGLGLFAGRSGATLAKPAIVRLAGFVTTLMGGALAAGF